MYILNLSKDKIINTFYSFLPILIFCLLKNKFDLLSNIFYKKNAHNKIDTSITQFSTLENIALLNNITCCFLVERFHNITFIKISSGKARKLLFSTKDIYCVITLKKQDDILF